MPEPTHLAQIENPVTRDALRAALARAEAALANDPPPSPWDAFTAGKAYALAVSAAWDTSEAAQARARDTAALVFPAPRHAAEPAQGSDD